MVDDPADTFAALFEQSAGSAPKRARPLRVGERVEGKIVLVGRDAVFIEIDGKREAYIEAVELRAPDGTLSVQVGDTFAAQIVAIDGTSGQIRLGRSMAQSGDVESLQRAKEAGLGVEGQITGVNKGGLEVTVSGHRAFCPMSQVERRGGTSDPKELIGQTLSFLVTEVKDGGRNIVLSRRALLDREAAEGAKKTLDALAANTVVRGTVTAIRDFGAFVDLGGVEGLIPASEISHDRGRAVADAVHAGDVVEVLVREIKDGPKPGGPKRITLSLKAMTAAPERAPTAHTLNPKEAAPTIGAIVPGKVDHIETYGVFVQLDGVQGRLGRGLVPNAELGVPRGTDLRKVFPAGTPVVVKVLETGDRKLRLSIKGAKDDEERSHFEQAREKAAAPKTLGTLGDLLKNRKV